VLVSSSDDGTVKLWNIQIGNSLATLNVTEGDGYHTIFGLVTLPDGRLITGDSDLTQSIRFIDKY
jgi:WD40 repeat protein